MTPIQQWIALVVAVAIAAGVASRRFAANASNGHRLLSDAERRALLSSESFARAIQIIYEDNFAVLVGLFRRQRNGRAEGWRLLTWLAVAIDVVLLAKGAPNPTGAASPVAGVALAAGLAPLVIGTFWLWQFGIERKFGRTGWWAWVSALGVIVAFASLLALLLFKRG